MYPDYTAEMVASLEQSLQAAGTDPAAIDSEVSKTRSYFTTANQARYSFVGNLMSGLIFSLLSSVIVSLRGKD